VRCSPRSEKRFDAIYVIGNDFAFDHFTSKAIAHECGDSRAAKIDHGALRAAITRGEHDGTNAIIWRCA
jgi:hypothetical protein